MNGDREKVMRRHQAEVCAGAQQVSLTSSGAGSAAAALSVVLSLCQHAKTALLHLAEYRKSLKYREPCLVVLRQRVPRN